MSLDSILYSVGLSGMFSSRTFLPAFATSLAMRYGDKIPMLKDVDFIRAAGENPNWLTHGGVVAALGGLSLAEILAERSPAIRETMDEFSVYAKSIVAGLTTFGVLSAGDASFIEGMGQQAGVFDLLPAAASAGLTYFFGTARNGALEILSEADSDDDLGIRGFIGWVENLWAMFGVWLLAIMIVPVLAAIGCSMGVLQLFKMRHEKKRDEAMVPCSSCGQRIHSFATQCHHCETAVPAPRRLGFLGNLSEETEPDALAQKLSLAELKRSPKSGEPIKGRGVDVACEADGVKPFSDPALTEAYLGMVAARLPKVLGLGALFGLLPGIGMVFGVVYYRFQLVAPFRRYLPFGRGFFVKWLIRLFFLAMILFQFTPGAGAAAVPILALVNYWFYRRAFKGALEDARSAQA